MGLPISEARHLASPQGPLRDAGGYLEPGIIMHLGDGTVRMDYDAVRSLQRRHGQDWRVELNGTGLCLVTPGGTYLLREAR